MSWAEIFNSNRTYMAETDMALRFALAALAGAAIGFERELRDRPAGLRTHMLTALAAAVFTVITFEIFHMVRLMDERISVDPIRVVEAVTAGVAFLAAGTIIQSRGRVEGLTTGAGMWLAGAVGVACGAGFFRLAAIAVVLALFIILGLRKVERHILATKEAADADPGKGRKD